MVFQANQWSPGSPSGPLPDLSSFRRPWNRHGTWPWRADRLGPVCWCLVLVTRRGAPSMRSPCFFFQKKRIKEASACSYCSLMFFACVCLCILMHHDIFGHTRTTFFKMNYNMDVRSVAKHWNSMSLGIWDRGVGNSWAMFWLGLGMLWHFES